MKWRILIVAALLAAILAVPFLLRPKDHLLTGTQDVIVVMTPHNEAIRSEFSRAFAEYYRRQTGRTVRIDWRMPGGTSEIARYLGSEFYTAFQNEWQAGGHSWNAVVASAFDNPKQPLDNTEAGQARKAFLASPAGIGIDLFFGGGAYDFAQQAEAGRLVDCGALQRHPDWFQEGTIPQNVSGATFYDAQGRWFGAVLASFGICFNPDSLRRLGCERVPAAWSDLADPLFIRQVALADPTKSGSAAKAYEMVIQQQMQALGDKRLDEGWEIGLKIIQAATANARYFTDAASRVPVDVSSGDAGIGMCIDFYGRFQSEAVKVGDGPSRLQYFTPAGGSSIDVDPIGLLRGAPHAEAAKMFIDFVLSLDGQKLWNFRPGTPGGPQRYALRRLPIRKELYEPQYRADRSDPDVFPYEEAKLFTYHPAWTAPLFRTLSFVVRVMALDCHDEQSAAWEALAAAGFPPEATACFQDLSRVSYGQAKGTIKPILSGSDRLAEVRLAREMTDAFRAQYKRAETLAKEKR